MMFTRILRTTFLALGLAMVWLGFFYYYQYNHHSEQQARVRKEEWKMPEEELEVQRLTNHAYSEEEVAALKFSPLSTPDSLLSTLEEANMLHSLEDSAEEAVTESVLPEAEKPFPLFLAIAGAAFVAMGIYTIKNGEAQKKPAS